MKMQYFLYSIRPIFLRLYIDIFSNIFHVSIHLVTKFSRLDIEEKLQLFSFLISILGRHFVAIFLNIYTLLLHIIFAQKALDIQVFTIDYLT